jgi:hypothetical protein
MFVDRDEQASGATKRSMMMVLSNPPFDRNNLMVGQFEKKEKRQKMSQIVGMFSVQLR